MGTPYQRQDVSNNIANGNIINADDLDAEFNALESAFVAATGHSHDGTVGEGGPITVIGPVQDLIVSGTQVLPKTNNTLDLGSSAFRFKDAWLAGALTANSATLASAVVTSADINGGTIDATVIGATTPAAATVTTLAATSGTVGGVAITTASNTQTLTNKSIDLTSNTLTATSAQLRAAVTDETGTGALVFADSPAFAGTPTAPTAVAGTNTTQVATTAHVFAERTNTATLTNKTLTSPTINTATISGGTINNTPVGATTRSSGAFTTLDANGDVVLGDAAGDIVTVNGTATFVNGAVGVGGVAAASAQLDVQSTTRGFLPPRMTTTQRDAIVSPANGLTIYNTTLNRMEIYSTAAVAWVPVGAGATGGGSDQIFWENGQTVTTPYTITNGKNAMSAGPITINSGITVTVGDGEVWTIV